MKKGPPVLRTPRSRALTDEDIEIWISVARSVKPRHGRHLPQLPKQAEAAEMAEPAGSAKPIPAPAEPAALKGDRLPVLAGVERRLKARLSQGKAGVDAVLDLHGMHQHTAFGALRSFLGAAQRDGAKLVLVITGKGERVSSDPLEQGGVLRRSVPHWLAAPELRSVVIGFEEATRPHGGSGALYVRIRRRDRIAAARKGR